MLGKQRHIRKFLPYLLMPLPFISTASHALIGMIDYGYGTISKSMAGASVASPQDVFASSSNPAGIVDVDRQAEVGFSVSSPRRGYTANNPGGIFLVAPGTHWSRSNYFFIPNAGYVGSIIKDKLSYGMSMYGNGGMNANYTANMTGSTIGGKTGVYGAGGRAAATDLRQLFLNLSLAWKASNNLSLGVSLLPVVQSFEAEGLSPFQAFSVSPNKVSDNGRRYTYGLGARAGVLFKVNPYLSLGTSYQPKIPMTRFTNYAGLLEGKGSLDIPSTGTIGVSLKPAQNWLLNFDIQKIWYSSVAAISNPNTCSITSGKPCLGFDNAAGFGWNNPLAFKLGTQWKYNELWTWRLGYMHYNQVIPSSQTVFNIIAPGVVSDQFTGGFTRMFGKALAFNIGAMISPQVRVTGSNQFNKNQSITIFMSHYEAFASITWKFDADDAWKDVAPQTTGKWRKV